MNEKRSPVELVREGFAATPFMRWLGVEVTDAGRGWCGVTLKVQPEHQQAQGFVHAGVLASLADHAAGAAARTVTPGHAEVVSVEFKINMLRPAATGQLRCRAEVLRAGRRVIVVESELFGIFSGGDKRVAKATVTLTPIDAETTDNG